MTVNVGGRMQGKIGLAMFLYILACAAGCAHIAETARGVAGISTKVLEDNKGSAIRKTYPVDYARCRNTVEYVLNDKKAYIYSRDESKKMIAFYLSESDTTPAAVFFSPQQDGSTEVAVSSPSRYARELISDLIAAGFDKALQPVQESPVVDQAKQN